MILPRRFSAFAALGAAAFVSIVACDKDRPPVSGGLVPVGESPSGPSFVGDDAGTTLPGCGEQDNGSYCECQDTPLFADAPNIYFVLDRSGSMSTDDKWDTVRTVVSTTMRSLGPRANVGATVFPGFNQNETCGAPVEVMSLRPGDPAGTTNGPNVQLLLKQTSSPPFGGTPTAAALTFVRERLQQTAKGKTFVVLATDGGPNCNGTITCSAALCQPNIEAQPGCPANGTPNCCEAPIGAPESCLDSAATISAVSALKQSGVPVYIIGLPGTATYTSLLNTLATSGGTAQDGATKYYAVTTAGQADLLTTLQTIAAKITATCTFDLKTAPADPGLVNVYFDETVLPADPVNGWKIDGATVTLLGTACDQVLSGSVLDVRIIAGCPTVGPR